MNNICSCCCCHAIASFLLSVLALFYSPFSSFRSWTTAKKKIGTKEGRGSRLSSEQRAYTKCTRKNTPLFFLIFFNSPPFFLYRQGCLFVPSVVVVVVFGIIGAADKINTRANKHQNKGQPFIQLNRFNNQQYKTGEKIQKEFVGFMSWGIFFFLGPWFHGLSTTSNS